MNQWEYQKAKKIFSEYLQSSNLTSYQIQTARLNLSTSMLVIGDLDSARQIIEAAMESIHPEKEKLLQFYFLEQKVQWLIAEKKYDQALLIIQKIQSQEKDLPENYKLTLKKWHLASAFYSKKINTEQLSNDLNLLENEAYQRSMPELLREIDFYRSLFLKDPSAYSRIYFGTSWKPYLKRLEENLGQQKHPTSFLWNPRPWQKISDGSTGTTFDIQRPMNVRYNSMQHKLLWVLSSDLYRQHSLGSLFHSLYPNEKFDPWTSKDRIMKLLRRTQVVIPSKSNEYSLKILHKKNKFYLSFDCELLLPLRPRHLPIEIQQDPLLVAIYNIKKYRPFTNEDIRKISDLSESQTYEDLKKIFAKGYIQQLKKRGQTTYCITKKLFPHPAQ
jgi:hypothetical protein